MKKTGIIVLLLTLMLFTAGCTGTKSSVSKTQTSNTVSSSRVVPEKYVEVEGVKIYPSLIHFYMYGMKTCPHCRHMHQLIPQEFGKDSLTYYELVNNKTNQKLFSQLAQLTGITGVPAIAITYNGTLYAVIEGEFNVSSTFEILATAMKNNGTFLFVGKTYLLPHNDKKSRILINALYRLFVKHEPVDVQDVIKEMKS